MSISHLAKKSTHIFKRKVTELMLLKITGRMGGGDLVVGREGGRSLMPTG